MHESLHFQSNVKAEKSQQTRIYFTVPEAKPSQVRVVAVLGFTVDMFSLFLSNTKKTEKV